jgi:hypothetical protein
MATGSRRRARVPVSVVGVVVLLALGCGVAVIFGARAPLPPARSVATPTVSALSGDLPTFRFTYPVTFAETGLRPGTNWAVTLNDTPSDSATTTVVFGEPNGTYPFTLVAPVGYAANVTSGNVTVRGGPTTVEIGFSPASEPPAPAGGSGGTPVWVWAVVVILVVMAALALLYGWPRRKSPVGA